MKMVQTLLLKGDKGLNVTLDHRLQADCFPLQSEILRQGQRNLNCPFPSFSFPLRPKIAHFTNWEPGRIEKKSHATQ